MCLVATYNLQKDVSIVDLQFLLYCKQILDCEVKNYYPILEQILIQVKDHKNVCE